MLIGLAGIAGACAGVNLLFQGVSRMVVRMAGHGLLPSFVGHNERRPWVPLAVLTAMTAGLMVMGFAGSENLDIAIRASLILWLLFYGFMQLAYLGYESRTRASSAVACRKSLVLHWVLFALMIVMAAMLTVQYPERLTLLKAMAIMVAMASLLALSSLKPPKNG
jgi:L-asparagine transporter-like permease